MQWSRRTILIFVAMMVLANGVLIYSWLGLNRCYEAGAHFCLGYASVAAAATEWMWRPVTDQALEWQPGFNHEAVFGAAFLVSANLLQGLTFASVIILAKLINKLG